VTWVANFHVGAYVWYMGVLIPAAPYDILAPDNSLLPSDCGELDYVTVPVGIQSADFQWSDTEADAYTYRSGGGFGNSDSTAYTAGFDVFVLYYNLGYDPPDGSWAPTADGDTLIPGGIGSGGTPPPPPAPPANDDFADRVVLAGACGEVTVSTLGATLEGWETSYPGTGATVWFEWTAPFTGVVLFRCALGTLSPELYAELDVDGHPTTYLAHPQIYDPGTGAEEMLWASVTQGHAYYLQVDDNSRHTPGTIRWQPLQDVPTQVVSGTAYYPAIDPHSTPDTDSQGYAKVFNENVPGPFGFGEYVEAPNPMSVYLDGLYVNLDGTIPGDQHEYNGMGLMHPVITSFDPTNLQGGAPPSGATIDVVGWGSYALIGNSNSYDNLTGVVIRPDGSFATTGSVNVSSGLVHPTRVYPGSSTSGPNLPTVAEILSGQVRVAIGISYPIRGFFGAIDPGASGGGEIQLDYTYMFVQWHHTIGLPVPPWSCGTPPLRQWQRSDVAGRVGQVTTNQASLRQGVANSYL
jgi:hypothetical protein